MIIKFIQSKEIKSIILSIVFLGLGISVIWILKSILKIEITNLISLLIFIPIITFLLFSGTLKSFKYGEMEATLTDSISEILSFKNDINIESSVEDIQIFEKEGLDYLKRKLPQIDNSQFAILILTLGGIGRENYYNFNVLTHYLETLSTFSNFKFVVFLNQNKKVEAYLPVNKIIKLLNNQIIGYEFIEFINKGDLNKLNLFNLYTDTINNNASISDALKTMYNNNLDSLIVTDNSKNLIGIVERDYLIGKLLLSLIEKSK